MRSGAAWFECPPRQCPSHVPASTSGRALAALGSWCFWRARAAAPQRSPLIPLAIHYRTIMYGKSGIPTRTLITPGLRRNPNPNPNPNPNTNTNLTIARKKGILRSENAERDFRH